MGWPVRFVIARIYKAVLASTRCDSQITFVAEWDVRAVKPGEWVLRGDSSPCVSDERGV